MSQNPNQFLSTMRQALYQTLKLLDKKVTTQSLPLRERKSFLTAKGL